MSDTSKPAQSPPAGSKNITKVGIRTDMTVDEQKVVVAGLIGSGEFHLQLDRPASLGTPISFAYWLREKFDVKDGIDFMILDDYRTSSEFKTAYKTYVASKNPDIPGMIKKNLEKKGIPSQVYDLLTSALMAELTITDLLIDIKGKKDGKDGAEASQKIKFGLEVNFAKALNLLPNIEVNKLSILVLNAPENDFTFPEREPLPPPSPPPLAAAASGFFEFSGNPEKEGSLTLNGEKWTFGDEPSDPEERRVKSQAELQSTIDELAETLSAATSGEAPKCEYEARLGRLAIRFKTVGVKGNAFVLAADEKSHAKSSGTTLKGGYGKVALIAGGKASSEAPSAGRQASGVIDSGLPSGADAAGSRGSG